MFASSTASSCMCCDGALATSEIWNSQVVLEPQGPLLRKGGHGWNFCNVPGWRGEQEELEHPHSGVGVCLVIKSG